MSEFQAHLPGRRRSHSRPVRGAIHVLIVDGCVPAGPAPAADLHAGVYVVNYRKLASGGVMAVNLAFFNESRAISISSNQAFSFGNSVVVVESQDPGNRILFATRGRGMEQRGLEEWALGSAAGEASCGRSATHVSMAFETRHRALVVGS